MKRLRLLMILLALVLVPGINSVIHAQQSGPVIIAPPVKPPDKDGDGLLDADDQCPSKAGPRTNGGCPVDDSSSGGGSSKPSDDDSQPSDDPNRDTDGDGLSDKDDQCPKQGGPNDNGGCPPGDAPNPDITPEPPTFEPPTFPPNGCFVTPNGDYKVNVRTEPDVAAALLGNLIPGKVYEADGYVLKGADIWFVLDTYEGSTGTSGYSAASVLLWSTCALIEDVPDDETLPPTFNPADDFASPDGGSPVLCHLSVGYDAPTWSNNSEVPSLTYAAFYFENEPGAPLPAGTAAWGVVFVQDFVHLPDSENVIAIAPDAALFEEAMNSGFAVTYNWPTMAGGIQSDFLKLYRLTDDDNLGACGPIVGIDDLTSVPANDDPDPVQTFDPFLIDDLACTINLGNWVFAFPYAPGKRVPVGTNPYAILNGDMALAGDIHNWYTELKANDQGEMVQMMDYPGWAMLPRTGGTCGPIAGRILKKDAPVPTIPAGGVLVALGDGSVHFVQESDSPLDECPEGWIYDIYTGERNDIFYCTPNGLAHRGDNTDAAPPTTPIECPEGWISKLLETEYGYMLICTPSGFTSDSGAPEQKGLGFECPESWIHDIYDTDVSDSFYCRPDSLTFSTPTSQNQGGVGVLECPVGWIHDIYDSEVNNIFYCRPNSFTSIGKPGIDDDVIVDGKIITAENYGGFGIECPEGWIHDIYDSEVSDIFYCRPKSLASRS